jgi:quercetin dioxygenase-like cupin family protein
MIKNHLLRKRARDMSTLAAKDRQIIPMRRQAFWVEAGAPLLAAMAAISTLVLVAERPSQAQSKMTYATDVDMPDATRGKQGVTHRSLLKSDLDGTSAQEVIVWDTEYAPRAINPRHYHPAAITFHVLSGAGIWQEDGKAPVRLAAGDRLSVPAGTTHSHWNPSQTEKLRFLEFIVGEKDNVQSKPHSPTN